jgi:hypothetical protein
VTPISALTSRAAPLTETAGEAKQHARNSEDSFRHVPATQRNTAHSACDANAARARSVYALNYVVNFDGARVNATECRTCLGEITAGGDSATLAW